MNASTVCMYVYDAQLFKYDNVSVRRISNRAVGVNNS